MRWPSPFNRPLLPGRLGWRWLAGLGVWVAIATQTLSSTPSAQADINIIIHGPVIRPYPSDYPRRQQVRVQFIAEGDAWASVYLDDRLLFSPRNFNRREEFWLDKRAYHLEITGTTRFDVWDSGYLDVGRGDAAALIVIFSKDGGVRVVGDPYAWLPDAPEAIRPRP